ncbi:hypothetical protein BS47DRAFT_1321216 [Hydnum rufescens UP504]|uniref:TPR-like protein n=1 Tax=Hydnum rufescens UP504 TaxID=1448309 RepID=A0A9P6DM20_9AGAM|nr:hypothetical protein BS47DRAFT_1321216 [Hydnum rufescens UP504]
MHPYTPSSRGVPASGSNNFPRTSLSNSISLGPEELIRSLTATSPRNNTGRTTSVNGKPNRKGKSKLGSVAHTGSWDPSQTRTPDIIERDIDEDDDDERKTNRSGSNDSDPRGEIVDRFRLWRHDAMTQHLYQTAIFWGDKVFTWTSDPNDAFWLAQAYFLAHQYLRAENILTQAYVFQAPRATSTKGKERNDLLRGNMPLMGGIQIMPQMAGSYSRLVDLSVACRYLAAQCSVRLGKWDEALEMLGEVNPFRGDANEPPPFVIPDTHGGTKVESTMCYLRGVIMLRMGRAQDAKESLMEALAIDCKNVDAFEQLVGGEMMKIDEEWAFIQSLQYHQDDEYSAEFVRSIYTVRLRKHKHLDDMAVARHRLSTEYGMTDNADVLHGFAEALFAQYRYADCFAITSRILEKTRIHDPTLPLHIACMQYLPNLRSKLFLLAHELMQKEPENPISSYAVAIWYIFTKKYALARRWISKTTLLDPRNGPAWIAFAHTFAFEGEHDQAVTAYSTCARLFRGTHLPFLYIGMEHLRMFNFPLAGEYLDAGLQMCDSDPLLFNELGVLAYHVEKYDDAVEMFQKALTLANTSQTSEQAWRGTYLNLGQAYRKLGQYGQAKEAYQRVVTIDPRNAQGFACLGMIHHALDELDEAITRYHEALSIQPLDANIIELLNLALSSNATLDPISTVLRASSSTASTASTISDSASDLVPLGRRQATSSRCKTPVRPTSIQCGGVFRFVLGLLFDFRLLVCSLNVNSSPGPTRTAVPFPSRPFPSSTISNAISTPRTEEWERLMLQRQASFQGRPEFTVTALDDQPVAYRHMRIMNNPGIAPAPSGGGGGGIPRGGGTRAATATAADDAEVEEAVEVSMDDGDEDASMDVVD